MAAETPETLDARVDRLEKTLDMFLKQGSTHAAHLLVHGVILVALVEASGTVDWAKLRDLVAEAAGDGLLASVALEIVISLEKTA